MPLDVAITAAALRTALGDDAGLVCRRIRAGETALAPVQGFDASGFGEGIVAAQIWTQPETPEDDPALRILGPHGRLLDAIALQAHAAAGLDGLPREQVGLFVALGMVDAPVEDLAAAALAARDGGGAMSLRTFFGGAYRQIHPLWPLSMLNNVAAGQIAIDLDIRGDNLVLASDATAGVRALLEAAWSVESGACRAALAAGVSGRATHAAHARRVLRGGDALGEGGATLVLERAPDARARGAEILGFVRGGASAFGQGASARAARRARLDAGVPGAASEPPCPQLGDLGAGGPAVAAALALARWQASARDGRQPRRAVIEARGPEGGAAALVVEEAP